MPLNETDTPEPAARKEDIISLVKEYVSTTIELYRLSAIERMTNIFANLLTDGFVIIAMILTFLFGSVTLGLYLGEVLGSYSSGFGIVSILYFVLALIMYFTKDRYVEKFLINFMVKRIFRNKSKAVKEDE